jgi:hypothetical protein
LREKKMSTKANGESGDTSVRALRPRLWKGAKALGAVYELNNHCLQVLSALARAEPLRCPLTIVMHQRPLWSALDAEARSRAAQNPVALLDMQFKSEEWWQKALQGRSKRWKQIPPPDECFPGKQAAKLARETLMLAWPTARDDQHAASLMFGMSSSVAERVAALTPQHIEQIASRHSRELRPRWEHRPMYWRTLLVAAQGRDDAALREVHLYSLQLIASEVQKI